MKIETLQAFLVSCFCDKTVTSQKGAKSQCRNLTRFVAPSATIHPTFIVMAETTLVSKSINAVTASISSRLIVRDQRVFLSILLALSVARLLSYTMITSTTPTFAVVIRNAITRSL